MVSGIIVAAIVGIGLGIFLQKGRFCFVNAFRDLVAFKDNRVTKGVIAATILTMFFWSIAYELGYYQGFWTPPWGITGIIGGFLFGVGMTYAGGCATGTLFRAGEGYIQFWLTLLFMGVGYIGFTLAFPTLKSAYFTPLTFGEGATLFSYGSVPAPLLALGFAAIAVLVYSLMIGSGKRGRESAKPSGEAAQYNVADLPHDLAVGLRSFYRGIVQYVRGFLQIDDPVEALKRPWDPRTAALGITFFAVIWFTQVSIVGITGPEARWTGYILQQTGFDSGGYEYWGSILFQGEGVRVTVDMVMIAFVVVGAFLAALWSGDFRVRLPKTRRLPNAVAGGLLMGAGSRLAPGCNIGNIYSGIAELSIHSFIATAGILLGVYVMTHWMYRDVGCAI